MAEVCEALGTLHARLGAVVAQAGAIARELDVLRTLEVNGRVEAARAVDARDVQTLFETIGRQVAEAKTEMEEFGEVSVLLRSRDASAERRALARADGVRAAVAALAG